MTVDETRYSRQVHIPQWDQTKLRQAQVIIIGVGALGTEVARLLATSGVGQLILCDPDLVEESNLSRGSLFHPGHIGRYKVAAAAQALALLAPDTVVHQRPYDFRYSIGLGELRAATLVISCLDNVADRIVLSSRCMLAGAPNGLLDAGIHPWGGEVRHFTASGSCYVCGCLPADRARPVWQRACGLPGEAGASGPVAALVAGWLAIRAERLLFGLTLPEEIVRIEAAGGTAHKVHQPKDEDCPCHRVIDQNTVTRTELTQASTVGEVLAWVGPQEHVQSWHPVDLGDPLSSLALRAAPRDARLADLGIAGGEILPVIRIKPVQQIRYLQLRETPCSKGSSGWSLRSFRGRRRPVRLCC